MFVIFIGILFREERMKRQRKIFIVTTEQHGKTNRVNNKYILVIQCYYPIYTNWIWIILKRNLTIVWFPVFPRLWQHMLMMKYRAIHDEGAIGTGWRGGEFWRATRPTSESEGVWARSIGGLVGRRSWASPRRRGHLLKFRRLNSLYMYRYK